MAIDWGRVAKGVATGYLGAKIANTEANDAMNADIIKRAGLNFYENTLPEFQKKETSRKETYGKVSAQYGSDVAEYMDQNGFIVGDASDYKNIVTLLGSNDGLNETKLKAYLEATSAGTYGERAEKRVTSIQDREKTIMNLTSGSSKIGNMTADLLIDGGKEIGTEQTVTTPAVEGSQVGPVITEAVPEKTEPVKLPSFEEIFGDTGSTNNFFDLDLGEREKLQGQSNQQYKTIFTNTVTGMVEHPKAYEEAYNNLPDDQKDKQTLQQYSYNRYFRERYLPETGYTYGAVSEQPKENSFVTAARYTINILKSNDPDDPNIDKIKADLKERLGTNDLSPYGL